MFRSVQLQGNNSRSAGLAASLEKRSNSATYSPVTPGTPSVNTRASTAAAVGPDRGRSNLHTTKRQGLTPLIIGTNVTRVTPKFSEILRVCLPTLTRGGARAVASPRSRRGHRNQMARSRHPRRGVRTRRRRRRRSCRCVRATASAGQCDTPSHIHTHKQGSHAGPKCAPSWRTRRCSSRPRPPRAPRKATPRHRRRS